MAEGLQLKFLDPKTTSDTQIDDITQLTSKAFVDFNVSIGAAAPPEIMAEEFGEPTIATMIMTGICKSQDGYAATNDDGKIVGLTFVDASAKGSRVASLGPVASCAPGAGKVAFAAACAHLEGLGFSTLVLMQVAANTRSFSLYAKHGFEAKHLCHYMGGFLPSSEPPTTPADTGGATLTAMTEGDVQECADLYLASHGMDSGWDRQPDIAQSLKTDYPFARLVARDADGKMVGYSTGFFITGHQVAVSQDVFTAMFAESSRLHLQDGLPSPRFHCPIEFPGLIAWALAQRLTTFRATVIMAKGHYEHAWPNSEHIVTPGIAGW